MWGSTEIVFLVALLPSCFALRYDPAQVAFNLNENKTATDPTQYWGELGHLYLLGQDTDSL